jgi:hypothetical protein
LASSSAFLHSMTPQEVLSLRTLISSIVTGIRSILSLNNKPQNPF